MIIIYTVPCKSISAPLNFSTCCHISGLEHKGVKLNYFFVKNQQMGHNDEVEVNLWIS